MLEKIGLPPKPSLRGNNWVVDATHCQGCSSQFTFINRKHHCRRCGGLFCNSCTQQRMVLRGQGDSLVRICEPCKKLEEAARFEMRQGYKNRAGRGGSKLASKYEDEVLNKILGNDRKESVSSGQEPNIDMLSSIRHDKSSASCSNIQEVTSQDDGGEILRSLSVDVHNYALTEMGSATPEELRQEALDEKKKYKILKSEGKSEEALKAFKRGKELERQAGALEIHLRKSRKRALSSINMIEIQKTKDDPTDADRKIGHPSQVNKEKDDLSAELRELGWSDMDLRDADKKPASISLEGELSSLLGGVPKNTITEKGTHGIDKSQVIAHKKNALALKREGKLAEAKEELKRAKVLEKQIEEQEFLADAEDSDDELSALIHSMDNDKHDDLYIGNQPHPNFNFDHHVGIDDGLGVDSNFEVTDDDMDDPEITAALKSIGWTEDANQPDEIESQFVPVDREAILSEIQSLKRAALNQKRAGNTAEAMALLKKAKVFEGDLDSRDSQGTNLMADNSAMVQKGSTSQSAENSSRPHQVDVRNVSGMKSTDPKSAPKSKLMIQKELLALKKRALALRREGRLDEAEEELKKGKDLEQQLEEMDIAPKAKVTEVNGSKKLVDNFAVQDVGDEEGDVSDQDMHDPLYLSLLSNLGWKDEDNESVQSPPKEKDSMSVQTIEPAVAQVHTGIQVGASRRSKGEIQRELLGLKRKSLALRRQGEAEEAEEVLKMATLLEAQLAEMEEPKQEVPAELHKHEKEEIINSSLKNAVGVGRVLLQEDNPLGSRKGPIPTAGLGSKDKVKHEKTEEIVRESEKQHIDESNSAQVMVSQSNQSSPQQEILAHKRKAVSLKREGKLAEAKEELRQAKLLEKSLEDNNVHPVTSSSDVSSSNIASVGQKDHSLSSAPRMSSRDRFKLQQESLSHKRQALKLRREGRMEEAEAEFELAKALETQLEELAAHDSTKSSLNAAEPVDDVGVEDLLDPQLLSALKAIGLEDSGIVSRGPEKRVSLKSVAGKIENSSEKRNQLEERIRAEKVKAVNLKRSGKQAEALDALRRAKLLEKELNSLAS